MTHKQLMSDLMEAMMVKLDEKSETALIESCLLEMGLKLGVAEVTSETEEGVTFKVHGNKRAKEREGRNLLCPDCGGDDVRSLRRITGYLSVDEKFNDAKYSELQDRETHM